MKQLDNPNIVKLIEVIDDPESDRLYVGKSTKTKCMECLLMFRALRFWYVQNFIW